MSTRDISNIIFGTKKLSCVLGLRSFRTLFLLDSEKKLRGLPIPDAKNALYWKTEDFVEVYLEAICCDVCETFQLWSQESLERCECLKSPIFPIVPQTRERAFDLSEVSRKT